MQITDVITKDLLKSRPKPVMPENKRQKASGVGTFIFMSLVAVALYQGWQMRDIAYLTAETGIGYWLGIVGGVMMLVLLLYPMRKRIKALRILGPIKHWFRLHMIMGILGPTLILFHCNFNLGALNSNVALFCMTVVAASGLLGRYFYSRIHHGLYGSQATVHELQQASNWQLEQLVEDLQYFPQLHEQLKAYEKSAIKAGQGWLSIIAIPWLTITTQFSYIALLRACRKSVREEVTDSELCKQQLLKTRRNLAMYFGAVRKVAEFTFYRRLFSTWHVLHLPLFIMMIITGLIHVVAVHMY